MRKIIAIFLILLSASPCIAGSVQDKLMAVLSAGGAAATTWVYSGESSDDYPTASNSEGSGIILAGRITPGARTITKLAHKINDVQTATECWIALYNVSGTPRYAYGLVSSPANGWNEVTVSYSTTDATNYVVASGCNQARKIQLKSPGTGPSYYDSDYTTYNSTPPAATYINTEATVSRAFRVGY